MKIILNIKAYLSPLPKLFPRRVVTYVTDLETIEQVIREIKKLYDLFNGDFYGKVHKNQRLVNLKKLLVDDFEKVFEKDFVTEYLDGLADSKVENYLQRSFLLDVLFFRYRVKVWNSLQMKLTHNLHEYRYVAKTINDLMGMRIIVNQLEDNQYEIEQLLRQLRNEKIISRFYFRQDGKYRAIHCYFQTNNHYFPWELQIWDLQDAETNYYEHIQHEKRKGV